MVGAQSAIAESDHIDADAEDIQAALRGDDEAYARLVRRYQPAIFRQMWRFTRDRVILDELVQEVFVEAFYSLKGFKRKAPFEHWLRRIATRVGYRHWKRKARDQRVAEAAAEDAAVQPALTKPATPSDAGEQVHLYLSQLAPADRLVLAMHYLEECDAGEIAERTGWSRTLVRVRAHRARNRLRKMLEDAGVAGDV